MSIKNIIFDLGGVILDIDFSHTRDAFKKLGVQNFDAVFSRYKQGQVIDKFEIGNMTAGQFRERCKADLEVETTDDEFDHAFNAMLLDVPKDRLDLIKSLRKSYKVFLLSNTNEIHIKRIFELCQNQYGFNSFSDYFDKEYYSHLLKKRKPNPETFLTILNENSLNPKETLFIDDTLPFVLAAKNVGIHAMHFDEEDELFEVMDCVQYIK